jgi:hypothetical protein
VGLRIPVLLVRVLPKNVRTLLAAASVTALCACGGGGGGGGPTYVVFYVASTAPSNGSQGVAPPADVRVTFSRPLDVSTVDTAAVRVAGVGGGDLPGTASVLAGSGAFTVVWAPQAPLGSDTSYTIHVSPTIRSGLGDPLDGPTAFQFVTSGGGGGVILPPATALRATLGRLNIGRRLHTATPLTNGRILFTGGFIAGTTITDRPETYDPISETFTLLSNRMAAPRASHAAVRLTDGRVLLCGGYREPFPGTLVTTKTAELFDPVTNTFTATGDMTTERVDHAVNRLPDGRVLVTGGGKVVGALFVELETTEIFDPATGTFAPAASMAHSHAQHGAEDLGDGRIAILGGSDTDLRPEVYTIGTGLFTPLAPAPSDRGRYGAAVARTSSGNVVCVGGEREGQVLLFDRASTVLLNSGSPTSVPRAYATATPIGPGRILVAGGLDYTQGSLILGSCDLLVEGGLTGSATYATAVRFPTGIAMHTATPLGGGRILFAGGLNPVGGQPELADAWLFTP